ncbi:uncharacterized protein LOC136713032 [Amia ocellicauda]|uniref:uncharacterized protein LOC136713032 n=1 Tax=Amia ocellicauda TaxID=2972642 RepID=UPI003463F526
MYKSKKSSPLPVEHPVEHPVELPVEHPVEHPVKHPVELPVELPVEHPVTASILEPREFIEEVLSSLLLQLCPIDSARDTELYRRREELESKLLEQVFSLVERSRDREIFFLGMRRGIPSDLVVTPVLRELQQTLTVDGYQPVGTLDESRGLQRRVARAVIRQVLDTCEEQTPASLAVPATETDVNKGDYDGRRALHTACKLGHIDMVKYLLRCGAKTDVTDQCGHTPLHLAIKHRQRAVVKMLRTEGATGATF